MVTDTESLPGEHPLAILHDVQSLCNFEFLSFRALLQD